MDFILNDKSLCGQFNSVSSFFDSLKNNVRCFELINDTEVRNTLGTALKSHVAQHFSKEVIVGSYLKTIAELNT